jgi:hypothetical protein
MQALHSPAASNGVPSLRKETVRLKPAARLPLGRETRSRTPLFRPCQGSPQRPNLSLWVHFGRKRTFLRLRIYYDLRDIKAPNNQTADPPPPPRHSPHPPDQTRTAAKTRACSRRSR